jgi:hypothetical protein
VPLNNTLSIDLKFVLTGSTVIVVSSGQLLKMPELALLRPVRVSTVRDIKTEVNWGQSLILND